jgi:hypothetical protein
VIQSTGDVIILSGYENKIAPPVIILAGGAILSVRLDGTWRGEGQTFNGLEENYS